MIGTTRFIAFALIFGLLGGCQQPVSTATGSPSSASTSSGAATTQDEPALNIIDTSENANPEWIACPEQRPEMCTQIYLPVCGTIDTGVRCVTAPCPSQTTKTFGNACTACTDTRTLGYSAGECKTEPESSND